LIFITKFQSHYTSVCCCNCCWWSKFCEFHKNSTKGLINHTLPKTKKNSTPEIPNVGQNFPRYSKGYLEFFTEHRNLYLFIYLFHYFSRNHYRFFRGTLVWKTLIWAVEWNSKHLIKTMAKACGLLQTNTLLNKMKNKIILMSDKKVQFFIFRAIQIYFFCVGRTSVTVVDGNAIIVWSTSLP
jgi:hypothetical protein